MHGYEQEKNHYSWIPEHQEHQAKCLQQGQCGLSGFQADHEWDEIHGFNDFIFLIFVIVYNWWKEPLQSDTDFMDNFGEAGPHLRLGEEVI